MMKGIWANLKVFLLIIVVLAFIVSACIVAFIFLKEIVAAPGFWDIDDPIEIWGFVAAIAGMILLVVFFAREQ